MDRHLHQRYLEYRELHGYFGGKKVILTAQQYAEAESEFFALEAKGEARDDEEGARFAELTRLLHRD